MYERHKYIETDGYDHLKAPAASIKYDGGHFFMVFNEQGKPAFISRRQSVKGHYPDRTEKLPQFHNILIPEKAGHVVSTELIHTGWDKNKPESHSAVSGILNSLAPRAIETQSITGPVRAVLLDVRHPRIETYNGKLEYLRNLEKEVALPDLLFAPDVKIDKDGIGELITKTKSEKREGVIITDLHTPEHENPRIKLKHYQTYNLRVSGIQQEVDKHGFPKSSAGALMLTDATGREVGAVGTGFSKAQRKDIYDNPHNWLDKLVQVRAMTPQASRLRMPVFNGDADGNLDTIPL